MGFILEEIIFDRSPELLKSILDYLPIPNHMKVKLSGFNYDFLNEQKEEILSDITLRKYYDTTAHVNRPTKDLIMKIYKNQINYPHAIENTDMTPRVWLSQIEWSGPNPIMLKSGEISFKYGGLEPLYITKVKNVLEGKKWKVNINSNLS